MKNPAISLARILPALVVACAAAAFHAAPAAAQTATDLRCSGCVGNKDIGSNAVRTNKIKNNAVTTVKIKNKAITEAKIKNNAVTGAKIRTNAVTSSKIADGQVGTADLAAGAVTTGKIRAGAVGASAVASNSVPSTDLANEAGAGFVGGFHETALFLNSPIEIRSVTITAPTSGVVIVNASGFFSFFGVDPDLAIFISNTGICSITTGSTTDQNALMVGQDDLESVKAMPFAGTRGFNVAPGSTTFRLVCEEKSGDVFVEDSQMTAIFLPTAY